MKYEKRPIALTILIFFGLSLALIYIVDKGAGESYNQVIGIVGIAIMAWCIISSRIMYRKYLTLVLMFEISLYLLTAGQSLLYGLRISLDTTLDLYYSNAAEQVNEAYIFTFFCIMTFHLGTMIRKKNKRNVTLGRYVLISAEGEDQTIDYTNIMITFGWLLLILSSIPFLIQTYTLLRSYSAFGYRAAYLTISGSTSWSKIFSMLGDYFVYSLFLLLAAYKDTQQMRYIPSLFILVIVLINFSVGNRSEPICYVIALLWFYKNYSKSERERRFTTIIMIVGIVIIMLVIPIIGQTRNVGSLNLATIQEALSGKESLLNSIKDTIITMGWSGFPTVKTMILIPSEYNYHYGQSYFFALLALVPNLLGGTHISVKYAGLPQWLKRALNMAYGPGFSMPAEAYYNFGWFGILLMLPFGYWIYKLLNESSEECNSLKIFLKMGLFIVLFSIPRREMMTALRDGVYLVGFIYWGVKIAYKQLQK